MQIIDPKTTAQVAEELGIDRGKLDRILNKYPGYKPGMSFGGRPVWAPEDIDRARKIVGFVQHGVCPHCGKTPDGEGAPEAADDE